MPETTVTEVMARFAALDDPKVREVNRRHGDDHGVDPTRLRAPAKELKTHQDLALELWPPVTSPPACSPCSRASSGR